MLGKLHASKRQGDGKYEDRLRKVEDQVRKKEEENRESRGNANVIEQILMKSMNLLIREKILLRRNSPVLIISYFF